MVKLVLGSERQLKSEMPKCTQKKSVRLRMQNYKNGLHKKAKETYVWPRTVEAAVDPFLDASGKNKMFFMIACNLFPESKIIQPSDTESDTCPSEVENDDPTNEDCQKSGQSLRLQKLTRRRYPCRKNTNRIGYPRPAESDLSWRSQYNHRRTQKRRIRPNRAAVIDQHMMLEGINAVAQRAYSNN